MRSPAAICPNNHVWSLPAQSKRPSAMSPSSKGKTSGTSMTATLCLWPFAKFVACSAHELASSAEPHKDAQEAKQVENLVAGIS